jgi:twitching motility two-component system response regulator PilG
MRLEFEPNINTLPLGSTEALGDFDFSPTSDLDGLLKKGISAAQNGDRENARKLLSQAAAIDPQSEDAWMWLASISEYPEELLAFLDRVLSINPENSRATEWRRATLALLAKTFVQRAATAHAQGSSTLANKCLDQALAYDVDCSAAWFQHAVMAESEVQKRGYLDRVLELDPEHEEAKIAILAMDSARSQAAFDEAKQAAVAGDQGKALEILNAFLEETPDSVEAWILKSHLSTVLEDKVEALETALNLDPENAAARSGLAFLALAFGAAKETQGPVVAEPARQTAIEETIFEPNKATAVDVTTEEVELAAQPTEESLKVDNVDNSEWQPDGQVSDERELTAAPLPSEENESGRETVLGTPQPANGRSVEEIFGRVETVSAENETVESFSPFVSEIVNEPATVVETQEVQSHFQGVECPYCSSQNDPQGFACSTCRSTLTLSDLEALFDGSKADHEVVQSAVTRMEAEWNLREFDVAEMTVLALGHFNLGNTQSGLKYLEEASRLDPNNVILAGQVNAIAIRLEEISRKNELHETQPTGKTILVVDDSPTVRKLISGKLEKSGHIVVCAGDGVEALECLENGLPDLVLLDITMPRMDGYEVCKQIRANPQAKDLPIVMISGKDGFFDKVRGRMAGSTGYVTKPFGPETLMKALETYLLPEA